MNSSKPFGIEELPYAYVISEGDCIYDDKKRRIIYLSPKLTDFVKGVWASADKPMLVDTRRYSETPPYTMLRLLTLVPMKNGATIYRCSELPTGELLTRLVIDGRAFRRLSRSGGFVRDKR